MASPLLERASAVSPTSSPVSPRYIPNFIFAEEDQPDSMMMGTATAVIATVPTSSGFTAYENIVSTFSPSSGTSYHPSASSSVPSTPSATTSAAAVPVAPTGPLPLSVPFPQPFDQSLSYSLTDSCVAFLATYLESEEMRGNGGTTTGVGRCGKPFGLLMSSSSGWATLTRNETLLTAALSQICYATSSVTTTTTDDDCSAYYRSLAVNVQKSGNCGTDLKRKNPVVLEALYDTETHAYCYAQAMSTTSTTPDDGYLYQLPVGIPLPSTFHPTCSSCSAKLVNLFTETILSTTITATTSSSNSTTAGQRFSYALVLEGALTNATMILKQACGSTFAGQITTMQAHVSSGAVPRLPGTYRRRSRSWSEALWSSPFILSGCVGVLVMVLRDLV
ncbi:hypothetical protein QFC21_006440 [Naganishia friedmannii]|uniref:Uncharacterized protein n=1 Tax=Naganishia friedmannii TaxID=89922 RepID=A0ACC2V2R6_9TREE|nr:hypothetical protein QFC21_006440 [Naganishia friedmannii]